MERFVRGHEYIFSSPCVIDSLEGFEASVLVEEPETIKEFLKINKISKKQLIEWLIENY